MPSVNGKAGTLQYVAMLACSEARGLRSSDALCWQVLEPATWEEALVAAKGAISKVKGNEMSFIAGKLADAESLIALKVCTHAACLASPAAMAFLRPAAPLGNKNRIFGRAALHSTDLRHAGCP